MGKPKILFLFLVFFFLLSISVGYFKVDANKTSQIVFPEHIDFSKQTLGNSTAPSFESLSLYVLYKNGTLNTNATWSNILWSQVDRAGIRNQFGIGGFEATHGSIIWYPIANEVYDRPLWFVYIQFWAKVGGTWYKQYITTDVSKTPKLNVISPNSVWELGWTGTVTYNSLSFPVYVGLRASRDSPFMSIKTNVTTPISLQDHAIEYQMYLNPYWSTYAEKNIRYVRVKYSNGTELDYPINQVIDVTNNIPSMTKTFSFLLQNKAEVNTFDFEDVFEKGVTNQAKIEQVSLPNGENAYIVKIGSTFGLLNAGEKMVIDPQFGGGSGTGGLTSLEEQILGSVFTSPSDCGTVYSMGTYLKTIGDDDEVTYDIQCAIYRHSDGVLIGTSSVEQWADLNHNKFWKTFTCNIALSPSTDYVLCAKTPNIADTSDICYLYYDSGTANQGHVLGSASWPNPITWALHNNNEYDIYADYDSVPTNGAISGTNWDDTDNCYAQKKWYTATVVYTDLSTYTSFTYVELYIQTGVAVTRAQFRYNEDTNTASVVSGSWDLDTTAGNFVESGNTITCTWKFSAQWDATEESDLDFKTYCIDAYSQSDTDTTDANFDVVTRLVTTGLTSDDSRINIGGTTTISGTAYYGNDPGSNTASSSYPPDAEFTSISIHNSAHAVQATDATVVNGAFGASFSIPSAVQSNTYHAYCNLADADGTDQDFVDGDTTAVVGDRVYDVVGLASTDTRINIATSATITVTLHFDYDESDVTTGTVTINGVSATHLGSGQWRIQPTSASVTAVTYNTVASTGNAYGITTMSISSSVTQIWDRLQVQSYTVADSRVNVNDNVNIDVLIWFDYDNVVCTTGTITINGFAAAHQGAGVYRITKTSASVTAVTYNTVACSAESTYGITTVDQNSKSSTVIWDQVHDISWSVGDSRIDVSTTTTVDAELHYDYDEADVTDGTVTIGGIAASHVGSGVWRITTPANANPTQTVYNSVVCAGNLYGITSVSVSGSGTVTWDRIKVLSMGAVDGRIDVGSVGTFYATAVLEYDNHALGSGDSLTINGIAMSWSAGNNRFEGVDNQGSVTEVTYNTFTSGSEVTYGITAGNMNSQSTSIIWDRIVAYWEQVNDSRQSISSNVEWRIKAVLDFDDHILATGDSLSCGWGALSWDAGNSWWEISHTEAVVNAYNIALSTGSEVSYGITSFSENITETDVVFDSLTVYSIQSVSYLGSGNYRYVARIKYAYDGLTIDGATVGVALPSGVSIGTGLSNSTGWVSLVLSQSNATTSGVYSIYGVDDNNYSITVAGANQTLTLRSWELNSQDDVGNTLTDTTVSIVISSTNVFSSGDTTIRIPSDTFNITVVWQTLTVNSTLNVAISGDTTSNFTCTAYPYTYSGTMFWVASDASITSTVFASSKLTVEFSGAVSAYTLKASCTSRPVYVLNCTYDFDTDWTTILTLTHYANTTISIQYGTWGTTYINKVDKRLIAVSWVSDTLSMTLTGNSGDIGTLEVNCGSRGNPATATGFTTQYYSGSTTLFTGTLTFSSDKTVTLEWSTTGSGGSEPGGQPATQILVWVDFLVPESMKANIKTEGTLTVRWSGANVLYIYDISFEKEEALGFIIDSTFPLKLVRSVDAAEGRIDIPVTISIPYDVAVGEHNVRCDVLMRSESTQEIESCTTVYFMVVQGASPYTELMLALFLFVFAMIFITAAVRHGRNKY